MIIGQLRAPSIRGLAPARDADRQLDPGGLSRFRWPFDQGRRCRRSRGLEVIASSRSSMSTNRSSMDPDAPPDVSNVTTPLLMTGSTLRFGIYRSSRFAVVFLGSALRNAFASLKVMRLSTIFPFEIVSCVDQRIDRSLAGLWIFIVCAIVAASCAGVAEGVDILVHFGFAHVTHEAVAKPTVAAFIANVHKASGRMARFL